MVQGLSHYPGPTVFQKYFPSLNQHEEIVFKHDNYRQAGGDFIMENDKTAKVNTRQHHAPHTNRF